MFGDFVSAVQSAALSLALAAVSFGQSTSVVMSNSEAREAATTVIEARVPPGLNPIEFTVRISVGADGAVKGVTNPHSLPGPLFAAAAEAAMRWRFPSNREGGRRQGFEADISFHGPITGTVTAKNGTPIAGVVVAGSEWTCCPVQRDIFKTDSRGAFRIEHPGAVVHFFPSDKFEPKSLVVTSEMSTLNVMLESSSDSLSLAQCGNPQTGFERLGAGKYGLQFDVPRKDVAIKRGKTDVDYLLDVVKSKHSDDRIEFWFGPYALSTTPDDKRFIESAAFVSRNVVIPPNQAGKDDGGAIGMDSSGRLPNGTAWRQLAVAGDGGALYFGVSPEDAIVFDRIINSACWIPYPKH